jgi:hypothetical protein
MRKIILSGLLSILLSWNTNICYSNNQKPFKNLENITNSITNPNLNNNSGSFYKYQRELSDEEIKKTRIYDIELDSFHTEYLVSLMKKSNSFSSPKLDKLNGLGINVKGNINSENLEMLINSIDVFHKERHSSFKNYLVIFATDETYKGKKISIPYGMGEFQGFHVKEGKLLVLLKPNFTTTVHEFGHAVLDNHPQYNELKQKWLEISFFLNEKKLKVKDAYNLPLRNLNLSMTAPINGFFKGYGMKNFDEDVCTSLEGVANVINTQSDSCYEGLVSRINLLNEFKIINQKSFTVWINEAENEISFARETRKKAKEYVNSHLSCKSNPNEIQTSINLLLNKLNYQIYKEEYLDKILTIFDCPTINNSIKNLTIAYFPENNPKCLEKLFQYLDKDSEIQRKAVEYVADCEIKTDLDKYEEKFKELINHSDIVIRLYTASFFYYNGSESYVNEIKPLLNDAFAITQEYAILYLTKHGNQNYRKDIEPILSRGDDGTTFAALEFYNKYGVEDDKKIIEPFTKHKNHQISNLAKSFMRKYN